MGAGCCQVEVQLHAALVRVEELAGRPWTVVPDELVSMWEALLPLAPERRDGSAISRAADALEAATFEDDFVDAIYLHETLSEAADLLLQALLDH
jgi:hypothetical protein